MAVPGTDHANAGEHDGEHDGAHLPAFHSPRPYWHPLTTPAGTVVTEAQPDDHPWHWGLSLAIPNIRVRAFDATCNLWGGPTFALPEGYEDRGDNGRQEVTAASHEDGRLLQRIEWRLPDGRPFVREERETESLVEPAGAARTLRLASRWHNVTDTPVDFGSPTTAGRPDAGYGGWFLRGAPELVGARVSIDGAGLSQEEARGTSGRALTLTSGRAEVTMSAAPGNPVEPAPWFVRTDPVVMLCAAPFFHREWALDAQQEATWRWSLRIADRPAAGGEQPTAAGN